MIYLSRSWWKNKWVEVGFQKYFQNALWMFLSRICALAISFLTTIYIARILGPTNYGYLSYAVSFTGLFAFMASLGIDGILYRDLIKYPERKNKLLGTAFIARFVAGLFTAMIVLSSMLFVSENDVSRVLIFILSGTFIFNSFQIILFEFQSRADSKYPSIIALFITIFLNLLKVASIAAGKGVIYLALILLLESLLYALSYIYIYVKKAKQSVIAWQFDKSYLYALLKDSFPLAAISAFSLIYARIDQVLIKHMIDTASVGIYDAAVKVAELWSFIPGILVAALYPAIVNAKKTAEELYNKRLGKLALFLFVFAVAVASFTALLAPYIIDVLYGNAFIGGISALKIYVWSTAGTFLGILIIQYLITENLRKILAFVGFLPMLINVLLNIIWIPAYGIIGAAYATLLSYSMIPLSLLLFKPARNRIVAICKSLYEKNI